MSSKPSSRRDFLSTSARTLGGGWMMMQLPVIASLSACARDAAERGDPFQTLRPSEARTLSAFASQILPSDDELPGAEEAGAIYFIDGALGDFYAGMLPIFRSGVEDLDERARAAGQRSFADLPSGQQVEVMTSIEDTEFFALARLLTLMGTFAEPSYGGNKGGVGWELVRMEHRPYFQPPFGYYDAEYARERMTASGDAE